MENIEDSFEPCYTDKVIAPEFTLTPINGERNLIELGGDTYAWFHLTNKENSIDLETDFVLIKDARVDIKNNEWRIYPNYADNCIEYDITSHEIRSMRING